MCLRFVYRLCNTVLSEIIVYQSPEPKPELLKGLSYLGIFRSKCFRIILIEDIIELLKFTAGPLCRLHIMQGEVGIKQGFLQQHVIDRIEILFHHALLKPQEILQCFSWRSCLQEKVGSVDVKSHEVMRIFKAEAAED